MNGNYIFTSESVAAGHPDKIADQISDAVLDSLLAQDKNARVACETYVKTGMVLVGGEITTSCWVDIESLVRKTINEIGYVNSDMGFDGDSCAVLSAIGKQSPDIAMGVDASLDKKQGAGDQGMMFGFACDETKNLMPAPITYSHLLMQKHQEVRKKNIVNFFRPDAKCQITFIYENDKPKAIDTIVLSTQHTPDVSLEQVKEAVIEYIIKPTIPAEFLTKNTKYLINPTGKFVIGGPLGDCGLTGRKIIVDTYGGMAHHGGGAFSGKDPSKVDRSAAYAARYVAKNIVAAKLAKKCEIQISYAIGVSDPTSININTFGTGTIEDDKLIHLIKNNFDLTPSGIIESLDLLRPIYQPTASFGHFGRDDLDLPWERTDKASILK